ncbi:SURF1 family protein [Thalassobacter stenotrophicus]|uniref:SURF1 family protein n=1 Tax=Thalassobacter stenotrophicus TaxID=266809 RepID=UPI0022A99AC3|nr:SURF1 family protein [Thalassobacter stenotrophicus]UYP66971.1 SURF1 family protein [Thalassobacter stenotrophicus]
MRFIFPVLLGLIGCGVLLSLGMWQVERLAWKNAILAEIDARIFDAPAPLPTAPSEEADKYLAVTASGTLTGPEIHVLASAKGLGAGYRVIQSLDLDGRRIMVDLGFLPLELKDATRADRDVTVTGNLHWPNEINSSTPETDTNRAIWFARDVPTMANHLGAEPTLIIARETTPTQRALTPYPVDSGTIPNDHLSYAITWFGLAAVWLGMTLLWMWRMRRKP